MRLLVVAATVAEVAPLARRLGGALAEDSPLSHLSVRDRSVDVLVTGVGMVAAAAWCGRVLALHPPDVVLNVGVCGSFSPALAPGTVVHVVSDELAELGAQDGDAFLSLAELGLADRAVYPDGRRLINSAPPASASLRALPAAHGITVNTVHGEETAIARVVERCRPDVESMEGAAVMYACVTARVPFAQVRAVSNRVERRNRSAWKLTEAIAALTERSVAIVSEL
jgi:futalosine hydrolase